MRVEFEGCGQALEWTSGLWAGGDGLAFHILSNLDRLFRAYYIRLQPSPGSYCVQNLCYVLVRIFKQSEQASSRRPLAVGPAPLYKELKFLSRPCFASLSFLDHSIDPFVHDKRFRLFMSNYLFCYALRVICQTFIYILNISECTANRSCTQVCLT